MASVKKHRKENRKSETVIAQINADSPYICGLQVTEGAKCQFSYSLDGQNFTKTGEPFQAEVGRWIGAKMGIFCTRTTQINDSGYADFDWFRVEAVLQHKALIVSIYWIRLTTTYRMKQTVITTTLLLVLLTISVWAQPTGKNTVSDKPWSVRMADSDMIRNPKGWMLDFSKSPAGITVMVWYVVRSNRYGKSRAMKNITHTLRNTPTI